MKLRINLIYLAHNTEFGTLVHSSGALNRDQRKHKKYQQMEYFMRIIISRIHHLILFIPTNKQLQSHPLLTCITLTSWHIAVSFPSTQNFHPATVQVPFPEK